MLETALYSREALLRERREGAVRAMIRAVGYSLARGGTAEAVGQFLFDSYAHSGEFKRMMLTWGEQNAAAFAARHMLDRWAYCDDVIVWEDEAGMAVESASMLQDHEAVMGFHGVTRMDMEACMETLWHLTGQECGLAVTYTIGDERDWMLIRARGGGKLRLEPLDVPVFTPDSLALHRRLAVASSITCSIGFAKYAGAEPEDLGRFFYQVWEGSGHYDRLSDRWGFGNAFAYAQNMAQARQILYASTSMVEDLDGYTISSPSWSTEIPHIMGIFGVLPDDIYRYFAGGGVAACVKLGLQYADASDDRVHRVWIRSR